MASEIEAQAVRWISELLAYRPDCGGLFVSGGNMANIVGFYAARASAGNAWRIRAAGVGAAGAPRLRIYASAETHTWVQKAADLSGLGTEAIRWIGTDADAATGHERCSAKPLRRIAPPATRRCSWWAPPGR